MTNKARMQKAALGRARGAAPKRSTPAINGGGEPLVVYFDDIRLVRDLLGDYDANLAVLEDRLGVEAVVNGNAVSLRGSEISCATAKSVLEQLYGRLAQGEAIGVGEVVGAIRHARALEPNDDGETGSSLPEARQIRTRKRLITARTPAQSAYLASLERNDLVFATGPCGHRQDLSRRRFCRGVPRERTVRPPDPVAARGRSRRTARFSSRRHAREGRPLPPPAL